MKIIIDKSDLLKPLSHIQSVVERKNTIPILSNVIISANDDKLSLSATDMDIDILEKINCSVINSGSVTVTAHILYDIVRKLSDGSEVEIEYNDGTAIPLVTSDDAWSSNPISETFVPEILITSPSVWVNEILPLNVTELPREIVASVASVCDAKRWVAVPEWAKVISTPLGLLISKFPSEFADAIRSPIEALLMAVITALISEVLEKSTVLPFIETWDAEGKFVKSRPNVTKLHQFC